MVACEDRTTGGISDLSAPPTPPSFFFFFFFWKVIYFTEFQSYNLCNSISTYGKRGSLGAQAGFCQRGVCKYGSSRQTSQSQRNAGGGRVRVRVSVMFEYVECVDFLRFAFEV